MSKHTLKFNDYLVKKGEFYASKQAIALNSVDKQNSYLALYSIILPQRSG